MPRVEAWECPHTKTLFPIHQEKEYRAHLAQLARERKRIAKEERIAAEWNDFMSNSRNTLRTPSEVAQWIKENFELFYNKYKTYRSDKLTKDWKLLSVEMDGLFNEHTSNSHSAPQGKKTNWSRKNDLPKDYEAITGRFEMIYDGDFGGFASSIFDKVHIYSNGGGGGSGKYAFRFVMWLDDWPGLKATVEEQRKAYLEEKVVKTLQGKRMPAFNVKNVKWD